MEHELAATRAGVGGSDRDLDAKLIRPVCFAFADAFDLGGVQGIEFPAALALVLAAHLVGAGERDGKDLPQLGVAVDLAPDAADRARRLYRCGETRRSRRSRPSTRCIRTK